MKLSIIIVNYNVKHFLELCLLSVFASIKSVEGNCEVIVVDNNSVDGSEEFISQNFKKVKYFNLQKNIGFSKANNFGLQKATGEFILFLNPDTVLQETTLQACISFFESQNNIGALGIKMIDGSGKFLPESKRALPNPQVAFYKIFGLSSLFPKSKKFGKYHLGNLNKNQNHIVDILSGAFFLSKKETLLKVGGFDEKYFMYGEDIDLSYSIQKLGLNNYYFAQNSIIHFKGESTKKGSLNYVRMFYKAMSIFSKKHFKSSGASVFNLLIQFAIVARAMLDVFVNFLKRLWLPIFDVILIVVGFIFVKNIYQNSIKASGNFFPEEILFVNLPIYVIIWLLCLYFFGAFDKPLKIKNVVKAVLIGTFVIAATYGFLPEEFRFSRVLILLATTSTLLLTILNRYFFNLIAPNYFKLDETDAALKTIVLTGKKSENKIKNLISKFNFDYIGFVADEENTDKNYLGNLKNLKAIVNAYQIKSLVFDSSKNSFSKIIERIENLNGKLNFSFYQTKSESIIGSAHKNFSGEKLALKTNFKIINPACLRNKRVFDLAFCFFFLLIIPVLPIYLKASSNFFKNWFNVFIGKKSWVGYQNQNNLPKIKAAVINLNQLVSKENLTDFKNRICFLYAKNYSLKQDFYYLKKYFYLIAF